VTDSATHNPLLSDAYRIPFDRIEARHVVPGIRQALERGRARLDAVADAPGPETFENTLTALDDVAYWVSERITPATHLLAVAETPELREAYNEVLPEVSAFWTRLHLHQGLWTRIKRFAETEEAAGLEGVRRRHLEKTMHDFQRAGADLDEAERERLEALQVELSKLQRRFSENVLDATAAWERQVPDEERLAGLPEGAKARARAKAEAQEMEGFLLTLDYPSVEPVLKYAEDRALRREVYDAYTMRCRDGEHDNRELIRDILGLRHELATLLGFDDFADYRLEDHMARSGAEAFDFERELTDRTRPYWARDVEELREHAASLGLDRLRPWDVAFVREALRRERYELDDEMLRPYFPLQRVMRGVFEVVERVFGFSVEEREIDEVWHPDVRYYELKDPDGTRLGAFYTDWFPRKEKRQGAWMNDFRTGGPGPDGFTPHLGVICGNFTPPEGDEPSLLTHREVQTIFHEFGHLLHHCTSKVPVRGRSGLNVPWDFVELPSQLMENWTWEREALDVFARHYETGEPIPDDLYRRMIAARRFQGGWAQMRQLSFGTLDLLLHREMAPEVERWAPGDIMEWVEEKLLPFSPGRDFAEYHLLTSFTHLFSGGYAAGYYSYLWSEVLDADVFTRFRDAGVFDPAAGRAYVETILSRGDGEAPEELVRAFLGRDPDPQALLDRNLGPPPEEERAV